MLKMSATIRGYKWMEHEEGKQRQSDIDIKREEERDLAYKHKHTRQYVFEMITTNIIWKVNEG
jgi:hypothetical protein